MKPILLLLATLTLPVVPTFGQALKLVSTPERIWSSPSLPVSSRENVAMEMLLMPGTDMATVRASLVQIAGTIAAPLDIPVTVEPSPRDDRLALVRFTAPDVARITRLSLRLSDDTRWPMILVFPSPETRTDQPDLVKALKTSGLHLVVCGPFDELRDYLKSENLPFEDLGPDAPRRLRDDEILLGTMPANDWQRLAAPDAAGRIIAHTDDPAKLPGVYLQHRPNGFAAKITLPLFPLLPDNPQARETLFQLLLTALTPETR